MTDQPNLTELTVNLLSSYLSQNNVRAEDIPNLIQTTHTALKALDGQAPAATVEPDQPEDHQPAVTVRKSLADPNFIISMLDGKQYKTLKRHLSRHGLTPEQYRQRYNLKPDYPMVAPAYSEHRRTVAKQLGLGRKPGQRAAASAAAPKKGGGKTKAAPAGDGQD